MGKIVIETGLISYFRFFASSFAILSEILKDNGSYSEEIKFDYGRYEQEMKTFYVLVTCNNEGPQTDSVYSLIHY